MTSEQLLLLRNGLKKLDINYTTKQFTQLELYLTLLIDWNQRLNLTATSDVREIIIRHILDSLTPLQYFKNLKGEIADIGSGAGLPGIMLAIFLPHKITLIESKNKKVLFLNEVCCKLELQNAVPLCKNINEVKKKFNIITVRAFAEIAKILKLTKKCSFPDTDYLLYKGQKSSILNELSKVSPKTCRLISLDVPFLKGERHLIKIKK